MERLLDRRRYKVGAGDRNGICKVAPNWTVETEASTNNPRELLVTTSELECTHSVRPAFTRYRSKHLSCLEGARCLSSAYCCYRVQRRFSSGYRMGHLL